MDKNSVQEIAVDTIYRNTKQPRKVFEADALAELAESIREHGVIQPITVEYIPCAEGQYMIVAGERRWRASKLAGKATIRALVQERSNHNGREHLITGLVENIQREDMNSIDEAEAYRDLRDVHGMKPEEIGRKVGKSTTHIYNALQRLQLQPKVRELMRSGKLSSDRRLVVALLSIEDSATQIGIAERAIQNRMTIPGTVKYVANVQAALADRKLKKSRGAASPAMNIARTKHEIDVDDETPPSNWNALAQLGKVVPWELVVQSANRTCSRCELRSMASESVCGQCPAVDMLGFLVSQADAQAQAVKK